MKSLVEFALNEAISSKAIDKEVSTSWTPLSRAEDTISFRYAKSVIKRVEYLLGAKSSEIFTKSFKFSVTGYKPGMSVRLQNYSTKDITKAHLSSQIKNGIAWNDLQVKNLVNAIFMNTSKIDSSLNSIISKDAIDLSKIEELHGLWDDDNVEKLKKQNILAGVIVIDGVKMVYTYSPYWLSTDWYRCTQHGWCLNLFATKEAIARVIYNDVIGDGESDTDDKATKAFLKTAFGQKIKLDGKLAGFFKSTPFLDNLVKNHSKSVANPKMFVSDGKWTDMEEGPNLTGTPSVRIDQNAHLADKCVSAYYKVNDNTGNLLVILLTNGGYNEEYHNDEEKAWIKNARSNGRDYGFSNEKDRYDRIIEEKTFSYAIAVELTTEGKFISYLHKQQKPLLVLQHTDKGAYTDDSIKLIDDIKKKINSLSK